jgi:hypothetical protein
MQNHWLPYQDAWLKDRSIFKIWEKSRRIGATYVQSFEDFCDCQKGVYQNVWFSSTSEDAGKEYLTYVEAWVKLFNHCAKNIGKQIIDKDLDIKATVIEFKNGSRINVLSSNPKGFRGKGGKIVLDEFAHHDNQRELWDAASACILWGGSMRILSTHYGKSNMFYEMINNRDNSYDLSKHRTSIHDAVNQGLHKRLLDLDKTKITDSADWIAWIKKNIARYEETWQQEFCLNAVENLNCKVVTNWHNDNIKQVNYMPYLPAKISPTGKDEEFDLYITCDFNASPNCWELAHVTNKIKDGKYIIDKYGKKIPDKVYYFDEFCLDMYTEDLIRHIMDKYQRHPSRIVIMGDASGNSRKSSSTKTDFAHIKKELLKRGFHEESEYYKKGKRFKFEVQKANGSRQKRFSSWNNGILDISGNRNIIISPACEKLIYNMEELTIIPGTYDFHEPTFTQIAKNPILRFLGHPFDAASYLYNKLFPFEHAYDKPHIQPLSTKEMWDKYKS